ncbi:TolC family protein [Chlamydiota bacterium]
MNKIVVAFLIYSLIFFGFLLSSEEADILWLVSFEEELSLEEVSKIALDNSLDIQIVKFDLYLKKVSLQKANSVFDSFLEAGLGYKDDKKVPVSSLFGTESKELSYSAGLLKKFSHGTTLQVGLQGNNVDTNSEFVEENPQEEAIINISISQSLGKNIFGISDKATIKITKKDIENSRFTSLDALEGVLYSVQKAYWMLVLKQEHCEIKTDALRKSQELFEIYKKKYEIGLAEKVDVIAIESTVKIRATELLIADLEVELARSALLFLLNCPDMSLPIIAKDSLETDASVITVDEALKEAIDARRDYKRVKNLIEMNKIELAVKKNALWPQIDLQASLTKNGITSSFADSWQDLYQENNNEVFVGISFKVSLENRLSKAELDETKYSKEQLLLSFRKTERLVLKEVYDAVLQINMNKKVFITASQVALLQQEKLAEEMKRFKAGRSSSDIIIRYENDVLDAKLSYREALFAYRISLLELELVKNSLLDSYWENLL